MHSDEGFVDQSPDALQLALVEGDLDYSQFSLLQGAASEMGGFRIEATVIGASHVIHFDMGASSLYEVFACVDVPGAPRWPLTWLLRRSVVHEASGLRYDFRARRASWRDEEPAELISLIGKAKRCAGTGQIGIVQEFPQGELPATPKTVIAGYVGDGGVVIETAHSYPEQGLVLSRSSLRGT